MAAKPGSPRISEYAQVRAARQAERRQEAIRLLGALSCLQGASVNELGRLLDLCVFRAYPAGATVLGQRGQERFFYLVLSGALHLRLRDRKWREASMGILSTGDCCGEGPLFGDFFPQMIALVQSPCYLLQIPLSSLRATLDTLPRLASALRRVYQQRLVECALAHVPLLGQLSPVDRLRLTELLHPAHYAHGSLILRRGSSAEALYLIVNGQVAIERYGLTLATLSEGDFFGEMGLLAEHVQYADVRALTPTDVLALSGADVRRLIAQRPDLEAQMRAGTAHRLYYAPLLRNDATRARELELVVSKGVLRGTHLFVRTPARCPPGCRLCEQACQERHGQARLHLDGMSLECSNDSEAEQLDVLDVCRQCSAGAECVEACPEDAFRRDENGALLITDRCTGCGACEPACPYGAITLRSLPDPRPPPSLLGRLLGRAVNPARRYPLIPLRSASSSRRADKCDYCHGFADRACLSRCPTGSLRLIAVEELLPL